MLSDQIHRLRAHAWHGAAGALALAVFLPMMAPDMGVGLPATAPPLPLTPAARLLVGPVVGSPGAPGWLGSSLLTRVALALPTGTPTTRLAILALVAGVAAALLYFALYRRLSLSPPSALLGSVVAVTGPTSLSLVTTGSADALLAVLVPGLLLCGLWWADSGRRAALVTLCVLIAVGVGSYPGVAIICGAVAVCLTTVGPAAGRRRLLPLALGAVAAGAFHRIVAAGLTWRATTSALGLGEDPFAAWSWQIPLGALRTDGVGDRLSTVIAATLGELGLPAAVLMLVGVTTLAPRVAGRSLVWAWAAALGAAMVWIPSTSPDGPRVVALLSWLLVGIGLDWIWRSSAGRGGKVGAGAVAVFLVAAATAGFWGTRPWHTVLVGATHVDRIVAPATATEPALLLTEEPVLDRGHAGDPSRRLTRVPIARGTVKRLHDAGRPMLAFDGARRVLERYGARFDSATVRPREVPLSRLLDALPGGTVVAAAGGPGLGYALSPDEDLLFAFVGGSEPLFGRGQGYYAVVGVKRRGGPALEQYASDAAAIELEVGDQVGGFPVRAMAALNVVSDRFGARVELNGKVAAHSTAGLALVAIAPDGQLVQAVSDELDDGGTIDLSGVDQAVSRVVGWEPCVVLQVGEWVDVGTATLSGGVGGWVPAPGDQMTLYATTRRDQPVLVWPDVSESEAADGHADAGTRYRLASAEDRAALQRQLGRDRPPQGVDWLTGATGAVVQRVHVARPGALSIELGEAPAQAYARYESVEPGRAGLELCGTVSGEPRFTNGGPTVSTVELARLDTIGWGWHDLEGAGRGEFRWSDGPEGGLLLQIARRGQISVEIEASSIVADLGGDDVTLTLLVNGEELTALPMSSGSRAYQWLVPADRWTLGMNRLGLRVSSAVSPAALGQSDDQRSLGLALRRLELALVDPRP